MARMPVKALCTLRKTSSPRPGGVHAEYMWLCLLYCRVYLVSGNLHLHLITKPNAPKSIHCKPFPPRAQWDTGCVEPCPQESLPVAVPTEIWCEAQRLQEDLSLLVPARWKLSEWLPLCCGDKHIIKGEQRLRIRISIKGGALVCYSLISLWSGCSWLSQRFVFQYCG